MQRRPRSNSHYVGYASGLPAPRYRGALIVVLTVAAPPAPQRVEYFARRQIRVFPPYSLKMRIAVLEWVRLPRSVFCNSNCQFQVWWLPYFIIGHSLFDTGYSPEDDPQNRRVLPIDERGQTGCGGAFSKAVLESRPRRTARSTALRA